MQEDRWQRLETLFGEALALEPEERGRYLNMACGDDVELRDEIEALLRADGAATGFLDEPAEVPEAISVGSGWSILAPTLEEGQRLGNYRIVRQIGEGGMGTVFLAERADDTFTRRVAIKVLRRGTESPTAIGRLERERQILASLDHRGIARLLDGGTTAAGLPYVVMELVEGEPIDVACERHGLSIDGRVDLMLEVCDAVAAAHRSLIVHRDLKPSNILIDGDGRPKLLDFGIAKLLDSEGTEFPTEVTESWDRRLTPSYASPEQLRGERITVATDVYMLGVVLYRLLAGELPFSFAGCSLLEVERKVMTEIPVRPSARRAGIDRDLDAIVLKALRGDREGRYGTVEALAADLRRYRRGLPVEARRGTVRYVAGKFMRRHWLPLATAATFALTVGAFGVSTTVQAKEIERTLGRLVAMEGFLVDLFKSASPNASGGREVSVGDVLGQGERQLESGAVEEVGSRGLLHGLFGRMALHLGQLGKAEEHLQLALEAYAEVDDDGFLADAAVRAQSDLALARLYLGGDGEGVERPALEALDRARHLGRHDPGGLLEALNTLTTIYCWQGKWEAARPLADEAHALVEGATDFLGPHSATALSMKALLVKNLEGETGEARRLYGEALEIHRRLAGGAHTDMAAVHNQLGLLAMDSEDFDEAIEHLDAALGMRRQLYPAGHWEIAQSLFQLGMAHRRKGDGSAAEELLSEAWEIYAQDPERGPAFGRTIFIGLHLAEVRLDLGRVDEARRMIDGLSAEWWESRKPTSRLLTLARRVKGCTWVALGRVEEGERLLEGSLDDPRIQAWEAQQIEGCLQRARGEG